MAYLTQADQDRIFLALGYAYDGVPNQVANRVRAEMPGIYIDKVLGILQRLAANEASEIEAIESSSLASSCKSRFDWSKSIALLKRERREQQTELRLALGLPPSPNGGRSGYVAAFIQYQ